MDFISFDPRLITENNLHDDYRPYRYEQNIQEQQNLLTNNDNNNKDGNNNDEYVFENQKEFCNEDIALHISENNASEYTTPESTTSARNASLMGHQQTPILLEFQLGLLVQDKIHKIHNHT